MSENTYFFISISQKIEDTAVERCLKEPPMSIRYRSFQIYYFCLCYKYFTRLYAKTMFFVIYLHIIYLWSRNSKFVTLQRVLSLKILEAEELLVKELAQFPYFHLFLPLSNNVNIAAFRFLRVGMLVKLQIHRT